MARSRMQPVDSPVAVVLAGGGARGAYEIGALSALLPHLEARGERPRVIVGTSVGAINAAYLAASADEPIEEVLEHGLRLWSELGFDDVLQPLLSPAELARALGSVGEFLRVPGVRLSHLLTRASEQSIVPDLPAALYVMRRLLSVAAAIQARAGLSHIAIAPERIVVTPRAEIVVVEAAVAAAIERRMGFEPDARTDVAQIALVGLSLILGRPLPHDGREDRGHLLAEVTDVAAIRPHSI